MVSLCVKQSRVFCTCIAVLTIGYDMSCICTGKGSDGTDHAGECTIFIGASLSEPRTRVTALQDACVCPERVAIYRK